MSIFDASVKYNADGVPLVVLAGKEYGSGSSRDWAAKGPKLLGVRAVIAESYERIHRSNLVGMGILPLQFKAGRERARRSASPARRSTTSTGLAELLDSGFSGGREVTVKAKAPDGTTKAVPRARPHRYAAGDPLLQARRHPAVRAPLPARAGLST